MTYSDVCREAAQAIEFEPWHSAPEDIPHLLACATRLRALASLLDTADNACVGSREADEFMAKLFDPLSDP